MAKEYQRLLKMAKEYQGSGKDPSDFKQYSNSSGLNTSEKRSAVEDEYAFKAMKEGAFGAPDKLFENNRMFIESEYNMNASHKERMAYDVDAYRFMQEMFHEDKYKNADIKDWSFDRYLANVSNSYLEEKFIHAREGDPDFYSKAGDMLHSIYEGDVDQFKLSAYNLSAQIDQHRVGGEGPFDERAKKVRDRGNVSIEAPEAEKY